MSIVGVAHVVAVDPSVESSVGSSANMQGYSTVNAGVSFGKESCKLMVGVMELGIFAIGVDETLFTNLYKLEQMIMIHRPSKTLHWIRRYHNPSYSRRHSNHPPR